MTCADSGEKATIAGSPTTQRRSAGCHGANATIGAGVSTTSRVPDGSDVTALTLPGKTFHSGGQTSSGPQDMDGAGGKRDGNHLPGGDRRSEGRPGSQRWTASR